MNIKEIIFWILLVFSMVLLIWNLIGDSPTEFIALAGLIFTVLIKMSTLGERLVKVETRFNNLENSFIKLAEDFKEHVKK